MTTEVSCGIVTYTRVPDTRCLLLHYESGHWDFPKGNQEKGESEEEAAMRELSEETGIEKVELASGFREKVRYFYRKGGATVFKEVIYFLGEAYPTEVRLSREHIGYAWLAPDEALRQLTFENSRQVLRKALDFLNAHR